MSNARLFSKALIETPILSTIYSTVKTQSEFITVDTIGELPLSDNNIGLKAFVVETKRLYIWNGTGWYNIALVNQTPTIDSNSLELLYTLDSTNNPTVINLVATDPEGIPITWSHIASDSAQYFATISNDSSVFTITPKSIDSIQSYDSTGGTFSVTFKASDGVNLATALSEFTITFAGPDQPYGWFGGGNGPVSTVDRIDYTVDTGTAGVRGPLSSARASVAATGNANYGWFGSGLTPSLVSTVDRIDYAVDTGTAGVRGPLSSARYFLAATGNTNYGWFGGGYPGPYSTVDRIDYATDTEAAGVRGPLSFARFQFAATGNNDYGWFGGGTTDFSTYVSTVDRIDYAADTGTAGVRGLLSLARRNLVATGNANYGWFGGGYPYTSTVDRIDYAADMNTALVRGPLSLAKFSSAATSNTDYGWFGGGASPSVVSTVDRIEYADDTSTAGVRGPLSLARYYLAATGGYPG